MKPPPSSCREKPPRFWDKEARTSTTTAIGPLRQRLPTTSPSKTARNSIWSSARKSAARSCPLFLSRPAAIPTKLHDFRHDRPDCPRAMAQHFLDRRAEFAKGLVVLGNFKERVVAKAPFSRLGKKNPTAADIFR